MRGIIKNWSNDPWQKIPKDPGEQNGVMYADYMVHPNSVFGRTGDDVNTWPLQDRKNRGMTCRGFYQHLLQSRESSAETNWAYNAAQRDYCGDTCAEAVTEEVNRYSIAWEDPSYFLFHNDPNQLSAEGYAAFCMQWRAVGKYVWGWFLDYASKSRCEVWANRENNYPVYCPKPASEVRSLGEVQFRSWIRQFLTALENYSDDGNQDGPDEPGWRILNGRGAEQGWQYSQRGLAEAVYYENVMASKDEEYQRLADSHPPFTIQMFAPKTPNDFQFCKNMAGTLPNGVFVWDQNMFTSAP